MIAAMKSSAFRARFLRGVQSRRHTPNKNNQTRRNSQLPCLKQRLDMIRAELFDVPLHCRLRAGVQPLVPFGGVHLAVELGQVFDREVDRLPVVRGDFVNHFDGFGVPTASHEVFG